MTVGPQIPHPVAPALVSGWGEGGGEAPAASQSRVLSWGREGEAVYMPLVGCCIVPSLLGTNRKLRHEAQPGTGELTDIKDTLTVYTVLGGLEVE